MSEIVPQLEADVGVIGSTVHLAITAGRDGQFILDEDAVDRLTSILYDMRRKADLLRARANAEKKNRARTYYHHG